MLQAPRILPSHSTKEACKSVEAMPSSIFSKTTSLSLPANAHDLADPDTFLRCNASRKGVTGLCSKAGESSEAVGRLDRLYLSMSPIPLQRSPALVPQSDLDQLLLLIRTMPALPQMRPRFKRKLASHPDCSDPACKRPSSRPKGLASNGAESIACECRPELHLRDVSTSDFALETSRRFDEEDSSGSSAKFSEKGSGHKRRAYPTLMHHISQSEEGSRSIDF